MAQSDSSCEVACFLSNKWNGANGSKKRGKKYFEKAADTDIIKEAFTDLSFTPQASEIFSSISKPMTYNHKHFSKIAQNLIKQRNKLLNLYYGMKTYASTTDRADWYQKVDVCNNFKLVHKVENTGLVTNHKVYDIPKKEHKEEKYQDGELTE